MMSKVLGGVGRSLITAGTLILLFVAYQLWGTGLQEARSQRELGKEYTELARRAEAVLATTTTATPTTAVPTTVPPEPDVTTTQPGQLEVVPAALAPASLLPEHGQALGKIRIPSIGVTRTMVEGVDVNQLKRGPGHYEESPLPGQKGNVSIAGHRTTYGQPFHNLDKIEIGDQIQFETYLGDFVYEVTELKIVDQDAVEVLEDQGDNRVTLIACHPKYQLSQRIIAVGVLVGKPAPEIEGQAEQREQVAEERADAGDPFDEAPSIDGDLSGASVSRTPAVLWGLACALIWLATWGVQVLLRRSTRNRGDAADARPTRQQRLLTWSPYVVGLPVFLVALYVFFENFGALLPGNY